MGQLVYIGSRRPDGSCRIRVIDHSSDPWSSWPLPPRLDLFNHSPAGFEWGYSGSGPAQTALAILVSHLQDREHRPVVMAALGVQIMPPAEHFMGVAPHEYLAVRYHQIFKSRVVAHLAKEGWELDEDFIDHLIARGIEPRVLA